MESLVAGHMSPHGFVFEGAMGALFGGTLKGAAGRPHPQHPQHQLLRVGLGASICSSPRGKNKHISST